MPMGAWIWAGLRAILQETVLQYGYRSQVCLVEHGEAEVTIFSVCGAVLQSAAPA